MMQSWIHDDGFTDKSMNAKASTVIFGLEAAAARAPPSF